MGDGSKQGIVIKDIDLNRYVAHYAERDSDPDQIVNNMIMLQEYYNNAVAMIEINRGGVVLEKYKQLDKLGLLAKKPIYLGKNFSKSDGSYGYYKNDHSSERGNTYLIEYLNKHSEEVWFLEFIEEAKNYLVENTDLIDAVVACELLHRNMVERYKLQEKKYTPTEKEIPMLEYVNGRYQRVWKKVKI
jgi:hypothetical protein